MKDIKNFFKRMSVLLCALLIMSGCSAVGDNVNDTTESTADTGSVTVTGASDTETSVIPETDMSEEPLSADTSAQSMTEAVLQAYYPRNNYYSLNFDTQKGMWFSYIEYESIMRGRNEQEFTSALNECFDNIVSVGCNTVYFQVRAYGDAYYDSSLFPRGENLTDDYDPLEIAVKTAHDRGLSIHAWINPMRLMTDEEMQNLPEGYVISDWYADPEKRGYISRSEGRWYINPAYYEAVSLICSGIAEIVTGYDVDGVQIDDYFYPTVDPAFDETAYNASGTTLSLGDWRRQLVSTMVRRIYETVHDADPTVIFGISPQGNAASDYETLYADVYLWTSEEGYCDYICPQIYYGFDNAALPFEETAESWRDMVTAQGVSLVIGLAAYKVGYEDKWAGSGSGEWQESTDILARQAEVALSLGAGYALFRYDSLFNPDPAVSELVEKELENLKAVE